jgi:TolA-binding protein
MKPACPRLFEVEALRDGRLTGAERGRFQTHLGVCSVCRHEAQALDALAEQLRSPGSATNADELHVRRERTRLLAAFDASLRPVARSRSKVWLACAALVALSALALTFGLKRLRPAPALPPAPSSVNVHANVTAKWSRQTDNQLETVTLESGTLSIHVDHALSARRLLVILPDGELEDIGTTFSVTAAGAQTTQVTVQEGRVILRLRGKPPLALAAGDSWTPAPQPLATASASAAAHSATPRNARSTASASPSLAPSAPASTTPASTTPASTAEPATEFHDAMLALNGGQNARAASLFGTFLTRHPHDAHAEDAAYLRVLALQRAGDASAMQQAATEYLTHYPNGFRHADVEPLSHK